MEKYNYRPVVDLILMCYRYITDVVRGVISLRGTSYIAEKGWGKKYHIYIGLNNAQTILIEIVFCTLYSYHMKILDTTK